ncbi:hypothetical protein [Parasphingorhabdus sp.]
MSNRKRGRYKLRTSLTGTCLSAQLRGTTFIDAMQVHWRNSGMTS